MVGKVVVELKGDVLVISFVCGQQAITVKLSLRLYSMNVFVPEGPMSSQCLI